MKFIIRVFLVSIFSMGILSSLTSCLDGACREAAQEYDIQGMVVYSGVVIGSNSIGRISIATPDSLIEENTFGLTLFATISFVYNEESWYKKIKLFSVAYATSCAISDTFTQEIIASINISSDSDFSVNYPAGSSLNELFKVSYIDNNTSQNPVNQNVNEFVSTSPQAGTTINLLLLSHPDISKAHVFKIEYAHTNGEYYELYTDTMNFQ